MAQPNHSPSLLFKNKKYVIVQNLSDHQGYKGEQVTIVRDHPEDYHTVMNDRGDQWYCGFEELQEV
jgi:hypothetical protein